MPRLVVTMLCCSRIFCKEDGRTPKVEGDVVFMPALAKTLEGFANHGPDYLYSAHSQVAAKLIEEVSSMGKGRH